MTSSEHEVVGEYIERGRVKADASSGVPEAEHLTVAIEYEDLSCTCGAQFGKLSAAKRHLEVARTEDEADAER